MDTNKIVLPQEIYSDHLESVNNVRFTRREIDIIAYLCGGRSAKTISSFLSITPKTIETHMRNIMMKLECNSRDGIIDFIEKSDKFLFIKRYYASLLVQACFERQLLKAAQLLQLKKSSCLLVYWQEEKYNLLIARTLQCHLKLIGLEILMDPKEDSRFNLDFTSDLEHWQANHALYFFPQALLNEFIRNNPEQQEDFLSSLEKISENQKCIITLLREKEDKANLEKESEKIKYIEFSSQKNYYSYVFLVLKKLFPDVDLNEIILDFKNQSETIYGSSKNTIISPPVETNLIKVGSLTAKIMLLFHSLSHRWQNKKVRLLIEGTFCLGVLWGGLSIFTSNKKEISQDNIQYTKLSIRPDLAIPTQSTFLERPDLMKKIEEGFTGPQEIKTVALVGIGGAGKTTLARYYARQQTTNVTWEINAETRESLNNSFENFAEALAKTEEERKKLKEIKDIKAPKERESKIISFVRETLKNLSNWLLIYDNVEKLANIQEYFPHDASVWGKGRVIILTRDKNIENSNYINEAIQVNELSIEEKLELFMNIMQNGSSNQKMESDIEKIKLFLHDIPPFPLDVSIAAYYLKITNVPYEKYLDHVRDHDRDFANIQENVLKEATHYTKTRYKIITLSLQQLINTHKDFMDLLLFISLLDFNNIPRDTLNLFKRDLVVENFIYNLKKYSLITHESASSVIPQIFSIHRSTQEISLDYIIKTLLLGQTNSVSQSIIQTFGKYIDEVINAEDLIRMKLLVPHCEMLLKRRNILNDNMISFIEGKLGYIYYYLSDYKKAKTLLEKNRVNTKKGEDKNSLHLAHTLMYLGDVYSELGDHGKAKNLCEESLKIYKKYFAQHHSGVARALAHLGNVYRRLGDYKKAQELCEQSLAIYKQNSSENPIRISWVLAHLGIAHKDLGTFEQARDLLEQSLSVYKQHFSDNHPRVAWVSAHLGEVYGELREFKRASHLLKNALEIYKTCFSENHVRVAWVTSLLGNIYKNSGDYEKARVLLKQSLINYEKNYGKNHTEMARILRNLGQVYLFENKIKEGENLIQRALETFLQNSHPESVTSLEILADLHLKKAEYAEKYGEHQQSQSFKALAVKYLNQAQTLAQEHFSMSAPQFIRIQSKLKEIEKLIQ